METDLMSAWGAITISQPNSTQCKKQNTIRRGWLKGQCDVGFPTETSGGWKAGVRPFTRELKPSKTSNELDNNTIAEKNMHFSQYFSFVILDQRVRQLANLKVAPRAMQVPPLWQGFGPTWHGLLPHSCTLKAAATLTAVQGPTGDLATRRSKIQPWKPL
ncbi:hypothetical protein E2C01_032717 [Portunus trituberculatus]|uniref:Uncharacterized protein n=1 Tax=Portunus trituberculatus TaxID=210409 RepID=A0A5B7EWN2_PORTR|nr:hypothetical protein [Portunus trituberculatus]